MTDKCGQDGRISRRTLLRAGAIGVGTLGITPPAAARGRGVTTQTEDVFGQGPGGDVVAEDGATLRRTKNGVSMSLSMPTPEPGTYEYPESGVFSGPGHPEAFTLWGFVFDPDQPPFDPPDAGWSGVFGVTGHVVGGSHLNLSGNISRNTEPFAGENLTNPEEAEVHLAVAPHGGLDPELMPEQIQTPTGPGPDIWWIALFDPPE